VSAGGAVGSVVGDGDGDGDGFGAQPAMTNMAIKAESAKRTHKFFFIWFKNLLQICILKK
jgi:hypothetical protein